MKKVLFGIFAHPDDEAFGPAGTLLKLKNEGYDIHLILLTNGEAGINIDNVANLAATRLEEWKASANILGASSAQAFHFPDGSLEKIATHTLEEAAREAIQNVLGHYSEPVESTFLTFEPNGLTGHHDHIAASKLATAMAAELHAHEIWYFCLDSSQASLEGTAYYEPRAREDSYITERIDVSPYLDEVYKMIDAHISQRGDGEKRKALGKERLSTECFHVDR